ncbi:MAG: ABC transporter ATP-binding protein [Rhodospirillaceae bacterium]|nr:ABC transporter ATP-binding protein [Rhodospirillaceae bacterium]
MSSDAKAQDIVIKAEGLAKRYHIYAKPHHRLLQSIFRGSAYAREFWALKDVSFEVRRGEVLGIIGRNGAGKSTLLQIICGTVTPTSGTVAVNGRVAALLELGAGFNPDFSGRENVYLNASIMGLSREETEARFDDIVAFAELADFIDEPVKTYSSGMFVRLAFSVAIHTSPDVLIVDEALSVGDFAFRNKCIKRVQELRAGGTTILFVSHDLSTLQLICDRAIWLDKGQVVEIGDPVSVSQNYHAAAPTESAATPARAPVPQQRTDLARFTLFRVRRGEGAAFAARADIEFEFELEALQALGETVFAVSVYRADGDWIIGQTSREAKVNWKPLSAGSTAKGRLVLENNLLGPGDYAAALGAYSSDLSICYALTELNARFAVRTDFPTWGKIYHPARWIADE